MNEEEKKKYEEDRNNHIKYINEQYKGHELELVRTNDLQKLRKLALIKKHSGIIIGILIFLGLVAIAGVIFYGLYYEDGFGAKLLCGNSTIDNTCTCPNYPDWECNCPPCSNECKFPSEIDINLVNGSI